MTKLMNKKVLIVGSNSFLARNLYHYLVINKKVPVKNIMRCDIQEYPIEEVSIAIEYSEYQKINFENLDRYLFQEIDTIFFFSGLTGTLKSFADYRMFLYINECLLLDFINAYCKYECKAKIIYPSTRLIYKQNDHEKLSENAETEFKSVYAVNKFAAEKYLEAYSEMYGLRYCILRICAPYGSLLSNCDGNYGTYEFFVNKAKAGNNITVYGDGSIKKTYTHILDICKIMFLVSLTDDCINDIYNVGGHVYSLQEVASIIAKKHQVNVDNIEWPKAAKKIDAGSTIIDATKLDHLLHIEYKSLKEIIERNP